MDDEKLEIYFDDLNDEAKKKVLEFEKINNQSEANFEIVPLFVLEK